MKFSAEFNYSYFLKATRSSLKTPKSRVIMKTVHRRNSEIKGIRDRSKLYREPQDRVLWVYFGSFRLSNEKRCTIKADSDVSVVPLTLSVLTNFTNF